MLLPSFQEVQFVCVLLQDVKIYGLETLQLVLTAQLVSTSLRIEQLHRFASRVHNIEIQQASAAERQVSVCARMGIKQPIILVHVYRVDTAHTKILLKIFLTRTQVDVRLVQPIQDMICWHKQISVLVNVMQDILRMGQPA